MGRVSPHGYPEVWSRSAPALASSARGSPLVGKRIILGIVRRISLRSPFWRAFRFGAGGATLILPAGDGAPLFWVLRRFGRFGHFGCFPDSAVTACLSPG